MRRNAARDFDVYTEKWHKQSLKSSKEMETIV
jgi:hypothetical protein